MTSACTNPVLYGFLNESFKNEFKEMYVCAFLETDRCLSTYFMKTWKSWELNVAWIYNSSSQLVGWATWMWNRSLWWEPKQKQNPIREQNRRHFLGASRRQRPKMSHQLHSNEELKMTEKEKNKFKREAANHSWQQPQRALMIYQKYVWLYILI